MIGVDENEQWASFNRGENGVGVRATRSNISRRNPTGHAAVFQSL
jgi:hypothetical protein